MKRIAILLLASAASCLYADLIGSVNVGTNSVVTLPVASASSKSISSWATGTTYAQGAYVRNSLKATYWTSNGGTSTNMPTHLQGYYDYADGVRWYYIDNLTRRVAFVTNDPGSTDSVWIATGNIDAVSGEGLELEPGQTYIYEGQKAISSVSEGSSVVKILEEKEE